MQTDLNPGLKSLWYIPDLDRKSTKLPLRTLLFNFFLFTVIYAGLSKIPLYGIKVAKTNYEFSIFDTVRNSFISIGKSPIFYAELISTLALKMKALEISVSGRKKNLVKQKLTNAVTIAMILFSGVTTVYHMSKNPEWVLTRKSLLTYVLLYLQLIFGGFCCFYLNLLARDYVYSGSGVSCQILAEYGLELISWILYPKTKMGGIDLPYYLIVAYTLITMYIITLLLEYKYKINLLHKTARIKATEFPLKLLFVESTAYIILTKLREIALGLGRFIEDWLGFKLSETYYEILENKLSIYTLLQNGKYAEIFSELFFLTVGFVVSAYISVYILKQGDPESLAELFYDAGRSLPGIRPEKHAMSKALTPIISKFLIRGCIIGSLLGIWSSILPLYGQISASGLVMILSIFSKMRDEIAAERSAERGKILNAINKLIN